MLTARVQERDFWVHNYQVEPETNNAIKMEVGIEECLHIEFEYNKSKYHLRDVVIGKIYFILVRIRIKHMEIAIVKGEPASERQGSRDVDAHRSNGERTRKGLCVCVCAGCH